MLYFLRHYIVFSLCITFANIITMDTPIALREITILPQPFLAGFLQDYNAVIVSQGGCHIVDILNEKIITSISAEHITDLQIDKEKKLIGLQTGDKALVYDIAKRTITWKVDCGQFSAQIFTPDSTFYVLKSNGTIFSNQGDRYSPLPNLRTTRGCSHATKKEIFYTKEINSKRTSRNLLYKIDFKEDSPTINSIELPERTWDILPCNKPLAQLHSPIANIIALYYFCKGDWALYDHEKNQIICMLPQCRNLAFHPTKPVIAMLMVTRFLELYNFENNKTLATVELPEEPSDGIALLGMKMDFSLDGKHLIFIPNQRRFFEDKNFKSKCYLVDISPTVFD